MHTPIKRYGTASRVLPLIAAQLPIAVFWLLPHDRDTVPDGLYASGAPAEAVDPTTLTAGSKGRKTQRSEKPAQAADV